MQSQLQPGPYARASDCDVKDRLCRRLASPNLDSPYPLLFDADKEYGEALCSRRNLTDDELAQ